MKIFDLFLLTGICRGRDWLVVHHPQKRFTTVVSILDRDCREWPEGATHAEILTLVEEYSRIGTVVVFMDE